MTVADFAKAADLNCLCLPEPEREITGGYAGDLLSWVMGRAGEGNAWITIMSNQNILAVATLSDVACIILSESVEPDSGVLELAREKGINLLSSSADTFSLSAKLAQELS